MRRRCSSLLLILVFAAAGAALPASAQPVQRAAAGLDLRAVAIGMTFVILTAGIDLSVGSLVALCGLVGGLCRQGRAREPLRGRRSAEAAATRLILADARGDRRRHGRRRAAGAGDHPAQGAALRGHARRPDRLPRRGAAASRAAGRSRGFEPDYTWWGQGRIDGVPVPVIIFLVAAVIAHVVLRYTRFGLHVYAVGGNARRRDAQRRQRAADRVLGLCRSSASSAGSAVFLLSARLNSAEAVAGHRLELDVIAAVVIGGTSLFGGIGSVVRHRGRRAADRRAAATASCCSTSRPTSSRS